MAEADNFENERLDKVAQMQKSSSAESTQNHVSPNTCATSGDIAACKMSESGHPLRQIHRVAQQLVMNSPDRQRSLIRPQLRATAPYDSPDSCPPPPNNTPDSGPSNTLKAGCTTSAITPSPYSTVKVLKPPEKSAHWSVSPVFIPRERGTPVGLAPPVISAHWTATPVSLMSTPGSTPGNEFNRLAQAPDSMQSSCASPLPNIVVTPPGDNSFALSTPDSGFSAGLNPCDIPRLRSDSEGSVSSILSLNSNMLKLISDTSCESISSSVEGVKGSDVQSDTNSDMDSPMSLSSKMSPLQSPNDASGKKKDKDMRKRLLQDLMSAEMTKREEEKIKKHNAKLMDTPTSKRIPGQPSIQHEWGGQYTQDSKLSVCGSTPVKLIFLILFLALTSLLVAWIFTDSLGPLQRRILVGDWDSLDAAKEPHRLPWIQENEELASIYKYGNVRGVITKTGLDIIEESYDEHNPSDYADVLEFEDEDEDLGLLDQSVSFNDLNRLEETNHGSESSLYDEYINKLESAIEAGIENESNNLIESSDSDVFDNIIDSNKENIENMKPTVLKLLYHNILKSHVNGDINMKSYTNMYRYLNSFLTTFGSFAATQSKMLNDRIHTLEKLREHNTNYALASTMLEFEIETGLIDNEYPISGSMIFTCLHRHLQYLTEALGNIKKLRHNQSLSVAFKNAYEDLLADYHHWFVEKFYLLGLSTLPTKGHALQRLNERFVEESTLAQLSAGIKIIIEELKKLTDVTEVLINMHNITRRIPAQVIT